MRGCEAKSNKSLESTAISKEVSIGLEADFEAVLAGDVGRVGATMLLDVSGVREGRALVVNCEDVAAA